MAGGRPALAFLLPLLLAFGLLLLMAGPAFAQTTDYDTDNDGLIEIDSAAKLGALRIDLDGNGSADNAGDIGSYNGIFRFPSSTQCPSSTCTGYELTANITLTGNWTPTGAYTATFDGNGNTISGLSITASSGHSGLFGELGSAGVIRNVGLISPTITSSAAGTTPPPSAGPLVGQANASSLIYSSYVSGGTVTVSGNGANGGGLVGYSRGTVRASHTTANVAIGGSSPTEVFVGGFTGWTRIGSIIASYAAGTVTGTGGTGSQMGGFTGFISHSAAITNSYCDSTVSFTTAVTACHGSVGAGGVAPGDYSTLTARTTAQLQSPTTYTGIYANWNINTDGVSGVDDPWYFGATYQYPQPSHQAPTTPAVDYDADDDDLIDVASVAALHAIRYDLNGDGDPATGTDDPYLAGFPGRETGATGRMGCPNTCAGYELTADLTFPATGALSTWTPIGGFVPFTSTLEGNGHTISGLTVNLATNSNTGLFSILGATGVVRNLGFLNPSITSTHTGFRVHGVLAGAILAGGAVDAVYVSGGTVTTSGNNANAAAGGLAGRHRGTIRASWSNAAVATAGNPANGNLGGLVGDLDGGTIIASYAYGTVTPGTGASVNDGLLVGNSGDRSSTVSTITNSYCSAASGDCIGAQTGGAVVAARQTASALQTPTDYTGIYSHWNLDLDANKVPDYLWNFGANNEYPILNTPTQRAAALAAITATDYDADDDGLIDISTAAQLNAVRWDLNGDGDPAAADANAYSAVFTGRTHTADAMTGLMGCPVADGCVGYELTGDLTLTGNWTPIASYGTTFDGRGHTISGLTVSVSSGRAGLFANLTSSNGVIRNVGVISPSVTNSANSQNSGGLVGLIGTGANVETSYVSGGTITISGGFSDAGGLAGRNTGRIRASYATAAVTHTGNPSGVALGGLAGYTQNAEIIASYAAGAVTASTGSGSAAGGLVGTSDGSSDVITNSYCDSSVMLVSNCIGSTANSSPATAAAHTTSDLQTPTDYSGLYLRWNLDLDADKAPDYLWKFGDSTTYPALNNAAERMTATPAATDYDADDDGLIDISTAAQLNAVRWDANGDGDPDAADANAYSTAFGGRTHTADAMTGLMGCPAADGCTGYELLNNLTLTGNWTPMDFTRTFDGRGHTISGLTVSSSADNSDAGLFGLLSTANGVIRNLGVTSPSVTTSGTAQNSGGLVGRIGTGANVETSYVSGGSVTASGSNNRAGGLAGLNQGRIRASYATAAVTHSGNPIGVHLGGLVGYSGSAEIVASYAAGAVTASTGLGSEAGGLVGTSDGSSDTITDSYCDSSVMLVSACVGALAGSPASTATAAAHLTGDLQSPTDYAGGIYANWNLDLDGDSNTNDDPWDFGSASQYPALKFDTDGNGTPTAYEFGVQGRPDPNAPPGNGGGNGNGGGSPQPVARGGGQPYHPASAHPEIYTNPRHEMATSCEVRTTGEGDQAKTTSTLTFDLGTYTRPITLVLSLWDGQFFRTLQSQNIPMPALQQDGQTATVEVVTDPSQTRFRIDSEYGLNLVLGYADCRTDDPVE